MVRTVLVGVVALIAIVGVLSAVFAVGLLRIHLADNESSSDVASTPTTVPSTQPIGAPPQVATSDDPKPDAVPVLLSDSIELPADKAKLTGGLKLDKDVAPRVAERKKHGSVGSPPAPPPVRQVIVGWRGESDSAEWSVTIPKAGKYEVDLVYSNLNGTKQGLDYTLNIADQELTGEAEPTRGRESYKVVTVGNAKLPAGNVKIQFHFADAVRYGLLRVRSIRLVPAT